MAGDPGGGSLLQGSRTVKCTRAQALLAYPFGFHIWVSLSGCTFAALSHARAVS